jgi:hypothetical protein
VVVPHNKEEDQAVQSMNLMEGLDLDQDQEHIYTQRRQLKEET